MKLGQHPDLPRRIDTTQFTEDRMKQEIKKVKVKAYNRKTHVIEVEYFEMSGHKFCYLKKNGNVILNTTPDQLKKLKSLFE